MHQRHGDDRADGGLPLGQVVPCSDWARATADDTTLCDEPVSTTKSRRRPAGEADGHAERHVAGDRGHGQGHRRPARPLRQRGRGRALRAGEGRRLGERRALGSGQRSARRRRSRCGRHRSGRGRRNRAVRRAPPSRPSGAGWPRSAAAPSGGCRRATRLRPRPAARCRCSRRRRTRWPGPALARCKPMGQPGVNGRLARPRVDDEGVRPLAADADVDRLGHLAGHHAHRHRHLLAAAGLAAAPAQPALAGGRAKVTCGSTWTVAARLAGGPVTAAARTNTSTVTPMATEATMSRPRCPRKALAADGDADGGDGHAHPEHQRRQWQRGAAPTLRGPER